MFSCSTTMLSQTLCKSVQQRRLLYVQARNAHEGYNFLNLTNWKIIRRRTWKELPREIINLMDQKVLTENQEAHIEQQPETDTVELEKFSTEVPEQRILKLSDADMPDVDSVEDVSIMMRITQMKASDVNDRDC